MKYLPFDTILDGIMWSLPSILLLAYAITSLRSKSIRANRSMFYIKVFSITAASVFLLVSIITTGKYFSVVIAKKAELTPFNLEGIWYAPVMIVYSVLFAPLIVASVLTYKSLLKKTK